MKEVIKLNRRNAYPLEYLKSLKFRIEYPMKITAHLVYIRTHYEGYNYQEGDSIDDGIKELFNFTFSDVRTGYQTPLIFEEQLRDAKKIFRGGVTKDLVLYIMQKPTYKLFEEDAFSRDIKAYPVEVTLTFLTNDNQAVNETVAKEYLVHVDEEIINKWRSIKKLDFEEEEKFE